MIYLIEPYNAYQKPAKKKHFAEILEEEALFYHMVEEQKRLMVEKSALQNNQNLALISQQASPSSQQVQDATPGQACGNSGAGGVNPLDFFIENTEQASFFISPTTGDAPITITFTNTTATPGNDTFLWSFGDGTTSTLITPPSKVYNTGSFTILLRETSSNGYMSSVSTIISASVPTVTAQFTSSVVTGQAPLTITFTNLSTNTSQTPTTTYLWNFGSASVTSTATNPTVTYTRTGSYTVSLQATGSYGIASRVTKNTYISASL